MVPIQSWSAVHPDMRSSSLVVLGQTNILILRDYLKCFLAWERKKQQEILGHAGSAVDVENLKPGLFVDLRFLEREQSDTMFPSQDDTPGQLAVADSRAFCIVVSVTPFLELTKGFILTSSSTWLHDRASQC